MNSFIKNIASALLMRRAEAGIAKKYGVSVEFVRVYMKCGDAYRSGQITKEQWRKDAAAIRKAFHRDSQRMLGILGISEEEA